MAYEMKPDTGTLFRNEKKEKENQPDYRGDALIGGVAMEMSAWMKTAASGRKYMSFSFRKKEARPVKTVKRQEDLKPFDDSDVPF